MTPRSLVRPGLAASTLAALALASVAGLGPAAAAAAGDPGGDDVGARASAGAGVSTAAPRTPSPTRSSALAPASTLAVGPELSNQERATARVTSAGALPAGTMQVLEGDTVLAQSDVPAGQTTTPVVLPRLSVGSHTVAARFAPADGSTPSRTPDVALTVHAGCLWAPVHCGLPGYRNTGVPTGTALRTIDHSVVIRRAGTVFQNAVVHGNVEVLADDVTVRNVRILVGGNTWGIGLRHADRTTIDRVEVRGGRTRLEVGIKDVYDDGVGTVITRSEITRTATGIQLGSATISGNFIHRMALVAGDHVNGITSNGSTRPLVIRRNTIVNQIPQTDAIGLFQDFGLEANRTVADNLLAGGGYTVYAGGRGRYGTSHDIRVTGNRFSRDVFARGGRWGICAYYDTGGRNNTWSGNVWDAYGHPAYR